ncbi:MAG TPA: glycosyltransferase family 4 protein [Actinomycetota bacterium]|nr:glycosyltransferase family 4 protein [Actinomycetota bacterium]
MNIPGAARYVFRVLELALAVIVTAGCSCLLLINWSRGPREAPRRRLLVLSTMYSLSALRLRQAEHLVTHRDLEGYFDHVWSIHPFVGAAPQDPPEDRVGPVAVTRLSPRHTMVEGRCGRFRCLERYPYLNFSLAQAQLVLLLDRIVRAEGVGIVRGDPYYCGLLALLLARKNGRALEVRIVANFDTLYESAGELSHPRLIRWRSLERLIARLNLSKADSVGAGSEDNRKFAIDNGARPERVAYTGNWNMIAPVHLQSPADRGQPSEFFGFGDRPVVICVSRLEVSKHPDDFVLSLAKARRQIDSLAGILVGEGSMRTRLEELCSELGLDGQLAFAGERDQSEIARLLAKATVVAVPLAGLALVESALSETPIVAYEVEWHGEFLQADSTGVLVPYRDTDAMAEAICDLVADPERARNLGSAARTYALNKMDMTAVLESERRIAEGLLEQCPGFRS